MALVPLPALRGLLRAMSAAGMTRYKWRFQRGPTTFVAIFIAEGSPYELLIGAVGSDFGLPLQVHPGFLVDPWLEPGVYFALCNVLQLTPDPSYPFKPADFLADLNRCIPQAVDPVRGRVQPHDVIRHRQVDTSDGRYFIGWRDNTLLGKKVQASNLDKTRAVFGLRVYETCRRRDISSCWTHDEARARDFSLPPE